MNFWQSENHLIFSIKEQEVIIYNKNYTFEFFDLGYKKCNGTHLNHTFLPPVSRILSTCEYKLKGDSLIIDFRNSNPHYNILTQVIHTPTNDNYTQSINGVIVDGKQYQMVRDTSILEFPFKKEIRVDSFHILLDTLGIAKKKDLMGDIYCRSNSQGKIIEANYQEYLYIKGCYMCSHK
ncbi:MAG: hypothetical protein ACI94Y_000378 [Maribacter sp.]|jgi:hypothetical protein